MTTSGLFSPTEVLRRVGANDWVYDDDFATVDGNALLRPTSISYVGTSASIVGRGSVEFTAVSSLSLNGVFSSAYDNYVVVMRSTSSTATDMLMRLRANSSDNSTASSYVSQYVRATSTTVSGARTTASYTFTGATYNTQRAGCNINLFGPYLAQPTAMRSVTALDSSSALIEDFATTHNQSTAYDGFTLYPNSGSFSGLVSVYGLVGA